MATLKLIAAAVAAVAVEAAYFARKLLVVSPRHEAFVNAGREAALNRIENWVAAE